MKCPHCFNAVHIDHYVTTSKASVQDDDGSWLTILYKCPACGKVLIQIQKSKLVVEDGKSHKKSEEWWGYPASTSRPIPEQVPEPYAQDFKEAALILKDSPRASAAISRRLLQMIIHEKTGIKESDLNKDIEALLARNVLPNHLADSVDAIRDLGNFSKYSIKSTCAGSIADVEAHEAEWGLDVLDGLFDYFFVQPTILQKKLEAINAKRVDIGYSPLTRKRSE